MRKVCDSRWVFGAWTGKSERECYDYRNLLSSWGICYFANIFRYAKLEITVPYFEKNFKGKIDSRLMKNMNFYVSDGGVISASNRCYYIYRLISIFYKRKCMGHFMRNLHHKLFFEKKMFCRVLCSKIIDTYFFNIIFENFEKWIFKILKSKKLIFFQ